MRIGRMLLKDGVINETQLQTALKRQRELGGRIGTHFIELGYVNEKTLVNYLSKQYEVPGVALSEFPLDKDVLDMIPPEFAQKFNVIPLKREGKYLTVAMINPKDVFAIDAIRFRTGLDIKPVVACEKSIKKILEEHYKTKALEDEVMEEMGLEDAIEVMEEEEEERFSDLVAQVDSGPVVKYVNYLLRNAVKERASDVHIEPYEKEVRVRFRIDGLLHEHKPPPLKLFRAVVSRLKVMAKLKVQEKRLPQDGRFEARIDGRRVDFRISTVPTLYGEKVALRILDRSQASFDLRDLGFEEESLNHFLKALKNPFGIILVTGPTGSGKTTTLYAALNEINDPGINITTAEDPVEYSLMGINQLQVNESIGLTFASALRAYLRQDPDVIMVGEIRDKTTTEIAIRAALTGHLVLSTVHTNSAAATITRLINMGVEPFLIASTIIVVVSQRLVRKICTSCKTPLKISDDDLVKYGFDPQVFKGKEIFHGIGCDKCKNTGYSGRIGLFEVLPVTKRIRNMILDRATDDEIEAAAVEEGMITLREAGIRKILRGETDIFEVAKETTLR
ncbi:MAG TPA: type IV-A pilus assembly ATPase PilB [candidate division WOR-3 bacterium]|uniref:Type IV-A pilus assembly ATPase PilB n=1 Tax=candidate division WOR-3 bacterium TaxID=2052148 RepID=A0A7C0VBA3_UNCW3|nr:type IV-A pilus assembly ATPase PilB [candidate division WOR-3 bacterium]